MNRGVGCRHGSDLTLLWLWGRPAAVAPIGHLAWEPPYAVDVALKKNKIEFLFESDLEVMGDTQVPHYQQGEISQR